MTHVDYPVHYDWNEFNSKFGVENSVGKYFSFGNGYENENLWKKNQKLSWNLLKIKCSTFSDLIHHWVQ